MGLQTILSRCFLKCGRFCFLIAKRVQPTAYVQKDEPVNEQHLRWTQTNGDKTLRISYDLNPDSIVFDVGGYEGQWASDIYAKYNCVIHVFEPVPAFADFIGERFALNGKIHVHHFGFSNEDETRNIVLAADGSSVFGRGPDVQEVQLVSITDFLKTGGFTRIDLLKLNIEGGEYDVLDALLDSDWIKNIGNIQVQFHSSVDHAQERMDAIKRRLAATHELTYEYPFVWENWKLKTP